MQSFQFLIFFWQVTIICNSNLSFLSSVRLFGYFELSFSMLVLLHQSLQVLYFVYVNRLSSLIFVLNDNDMISYEISILAQEQCPYVGSNGTCLAKHMKSIVDMQLGQSLAVIVKLIDIMLYLVRDGGDILIYCCLIFNIQEKKIEISKSIGLIQYSSSSWDIWNSNVILKNILISSSFVWNLSSNWNISI